MECKLCKIDVSGNVIDHVPCGECPTIICGPCDNRNEFMKCEKDCVIRCPACQKMRVFLDVRESQRSPPCGYPDQPTQHPESCSSNEVPDVPNRPILLITELIKTQLKEGQQQTPSKEVYDILYSA